VRIEDGERLYGIHPIRELLVVAPARLKRLYLQAGAGRAVEELRREAESKGVRVEERHKRQLDELSGGGVHQGAVALCAPYSYAELEDLLSPAPPLIVLLDSVVDPQNLGSIVRSAVWFGASGVVIPKDRAAPMTPAAIKASAGAASKARVARVTNLSRALEELEEAGLFTAAAVLEPEAPPPWELDFTRPSAIVIGAEGTGIRPLVRKKCQAAVRIPRRGEFDSLNAAQAAAVLLYEAARQRLTRGEDRRA
jgi:23S rRNA (guanosine2251-2'-O)-methyltransferase